MIPFHLTRNSLFFSRDIDEMWCAKMLVIKDSIFIISSFLSFSLFLSFSQLLSVFFTLSSLSLSLSLTNHLLCLAHKMIWCSLLSSPCCLTAAFIVIIISTGLRPRFVFLLTWFQSQDDFMLLPCWRGTSCFFFPESTCFVSARD